ncbi:MAG: hypothetical protein ACYC1I_05200 [Acidimicrobiales bacterium]
MKSTATAHFGFAYANYDANCVMTRVGGRVVSDENLLAPSSFPVALHHSGPLEIICGSAIDCA